MVEVQRRLSAMVAVCVAVLAGCSSSGDAGAADVEIRVEMGSDTPAFTASRAAVDDGLVCLTGQTLPGGEVQTIDGEPSSDEEFGQAANALTASPGRERTISRSWETLIRPMPMAYRTASSTGDGT